MNRKMLKENKSGITLIALIITIIILLILAGVSISMITGENGILTQASEAKLENEKAQIIEEIELAVTDSRLVEGKYGKIDEDELLEELGKIGILEANINKTDENDADNNGSTLPWKVIKNEIEYTIDEDENLLPDEDENLLPEEFQQIEYIESTGTQYIDTGCKSNATTIIEADMHSEGGIWAFGARSEVGSIDSFAFTIESDKYAIRIGTDRYNDIMETNTRKRTKVYLSNSQLKLDGNNTKSFSVDATNGIYNIFICALNQGGSASNNFFVGKIYSFIIWDNGQIIRSFTPCYRKIDKKVGLYDTVEGKFYTNKGTGDEFIAGPNV